MNEGKSVKQQKTQAAVTGGGSALHRYQDTIVGRRSFPALAYYEWCMWVGALPGALGLFLRKVFWPRLFRACGSGTLFGTGVSLRHPHRICLGDRVVIGDGCVLDARTEEGRDVISVGDDTILSNGVMVSCKEGSVAIGAEVGIGAYTVIHAVSQSHVSIGNAVLIGPQCYVAGGGSYKTDRTDVPISEQGLRGKEDVTLEGDIWLGAKVTILGGVSVGMGSVVGAGAVVAKDVSPFEICAGVPAKTIRSRVKEHP